ncbi:MAG: VWA domain-containing protein [Bacteroidota bacterium]|jgi:hypothetical protein|nr:VWA domain-containing protein [Bacteroidota bacterium]
MAYSIQRRSGAADFALRALFVVVVMLLATTAIAQPLEVRVRTVDARALPQIRLQVEVGRGGVALAQPGKAVFTLRENGLEMLLDVDCPDAAVANNIALVLDNSGSLSGAAFDSLKAGAHAVVDSLRDIDATAIYHFSNGGERVLDFTSDRAALHAAVSGLALGANTPIYQTTDLALRELAVRPGRKYCILFTDGTDNASSIPWEDLIPHAKAADIRIFIIGFGNTELSDDILATLARETGGRYWRLFSPALIAGVLRSVAAEIVSPWCTIAYEAAGCTDSLRFLQLDATLGAETASDDTVFVSPFRADTLRARVVAPPRLLPGERAIVYVALEPGLHTGLELTFRFLLRYDPALLSVSPLIPVTLGTMSENTGARLRQPRPGVLEFSVERATPGLASGNLIGVVLRQVAADSSRPVRLELDSLELLAGCPTTVLLESDTVDVCQCLESFAFTIDSVEAIAVRGIAEYPLRIPAPVASPALLRASLRWDPLRLQLLGVVDDGGESWEIHADEDAGTTVFALYTNAGGTELRPRLRFAAVADREPRRALLRVDSMTLYAACCADAGPVSASPWIDGICQPLLRLRDAPVITAAWPQPARDLLQLSLWLPSGQARLELYDASGTLLREQDVASLSLETTVPLAVDGLPAGRYILRLRHGSRISIRPVVIVR